MVLEAGDIAQVVEHFAWMCNVLGSVTSTEKKMMLTNALIEEIQNKEVEMEPISMFRKIQSNK